MAMPKTILDNRVVVMSNSTKKRFLGDVEAPHDRGVRLFRNVFRITSVVSIVTSLMLAVSAHAAPDICGNLGDHQYSTFRDQGPEKRIRGYICYVVNDDPNLKGVLTLKHMDRKGDWDILVGTSFDPDLKMVYGAIDYKNNSGNSDELLWLPGGDTREYVVVAYPRSNSPSKACLIHHKFNTTEVAAQAFLMASVHSILAELTRGEDDSQETANNKSRVIASGLSALNRNNLALVGYDIALNEISTRLAAAFGGGSWLFTFGVNYFGGYLEQSGKMLFDQNINCVN